MYTEAQELGVKINPDHRPGPAELEDFDLEAFPRPGGGGPKSYSGNASKKRKSDEARVESDDPEVVALKRNVSEVSAENKRLWNERQEFKKTAVDLKSKLEVERETRRESELEAKKEAYDLKAKINDLKTQLEFEKSKLRQAEKEILDCNEHLEQTDANMSALDKEAKASNEKHRATISDLKNNVDSKIKVSSKRVQEIVQGIYKAKGIGTLGISRVNSSAWLGYVG